MTLRKYSAWLALCFGPVLLVQTALRHWGQFNGWVAGDLLAAGMLGAAGVLELRDACSCSSRWLSGAWGFACATLWVSLFTLIPRMDLGDPHQGQATYLVMAGWLLITALIGFGVSLMPNQNARP